MEAPLLKVVLLVLAKLIEFNAVPLAPTLPRVMGPVPLAELNIP